MKRSRMCVSSFICTGTVSRTNVIETVVCVCRLCCNGGLLMFAVDTCKWKQSNKSRWLYPASLPLAPVAPLVSFLCIAYDIALLVALATMFPHPPKCKRNNTSAFIKKMPCFPPKNKQ